MKISHKQYLERILQSKKSELEHLNTDHMINMATYNTKKEMLTKEIYSIENQLETDK